MPEYDQWAVMASLKGDFLVKRDSKEQNDLPYILLNKRRGHVYVHGPQTLGAVYRHRFVSRIAGELKSQFPEVDVLEGDGEMLITWPLEANWTPALMDRLGARRRPRISEHERELRRGRALKTLVWPR